MDFEKFKPLLGTWADKFRPFVSSKEFDEIYQFLKNESRAGKKIYPDSKDTYKAFELCKFENLKAIIVGFCPYHTTKNKTIVADGQALSCGNTRELQPSLEMWYKGIEKDLYNGLNLNMIKNPDLSFLSRQGVLLYNSALTVEAMKPGSHNKIWWKFNEFFFKEIIANYTRGLPIVFLGKEAARSEKLVNTLLHYVKVIEHPAAASYQSREWEHGHMFSWINNILKSNFDTEINWDDSGDCPF